MTTQNVQSASSLGERRGCVDTGLAGSVRRQPIIWCIQINALAARKEPAFPVVDYCVREFYPNYLRTAKQ
ncbi:MAG: hypothetical protein WCC25_07165, partial [Candidatus Korobacteraceae bacterium]